MSWTALCAAALAACGAAPQHRGDAPPAEPAAVAPTPVEVEPAEAATSETEPDREGQQPALPCEQLDGARCDRTRCVPTREGSCRAPADECELVAPDPTWHGEPLFSQGDPCQRVRGECAYDVRTRRCTTFAARLECPVSLDAAQAASVYCNHSSQPPLQCAYPSADCACGRPARCSGMPPPPPDDPPPAVFRCVPHVDANGCPQSIREGTRCRRDGLVCQGCAVSYECQRGRWRAHRHGPPP